MKMRKNQQGSFIVEFAIIAAVMFVILFAAIEMSRLVYIFNTADEATRRGARLAAVCEIGHADVPRATIFAASGTTSPILKNLTINNVLVQYLRGDGTEINAATTADFEDVRYVRVAIGKAPADPFPISLNIPFFDINIPSVAPFETTLPSESLGYIPDSALPQFGCI